MPSYEQKNLFERIMIRQTEVEHERSHLEPDYDRIIGLFRPDMVRFRHKIGPNEQTRGILGANIYEGTGPWASNLMADGMQGNLVSPSIEWLRYAMDDKIFEGNDEVNQWLQDLEEHMLGVYREPNSNFYAAMGPFTRHGVTTGSPVIIPELDPDSGKILSIVPHPATRYFMQNRFGVTDVLHLQNQWKIRNAVRTFGLENMSKSTQHAYKEGQDGNIIIVRAIYFYLDRIFKDLPDSSVDGTEILIDGNEKRHATKTFTPRWPWVSIYCEKDAEGRFEKEEKTPLRIEGYFSKPFTIWHYEKDQSEIYSRTPAWFAYFDTKSLNNMRKTMIMGAQKSVDHAWWVPDYLKTRFKSYPGGINWASRTNFENMPKILDENIKPAYGFEIEAEFKKSVERWFHTRMWFMINRLAEELQAPPTATQILTMSGEKATVLGPIVGRYLDVMTDIDSRHFDIENRRGNIPIAPDIVHDHFQGKPAQINPEFIGPLAQLQKRFLGIQRLEVGLPVIKAFAEIDPMSVHKVKAHKALEFALEELKWPQDLINDDDEFEAIVSAIAQQQMLEKGVQMGTEVAKAVPSVGKAIEENSPVAGLLEASQG